MANDRKNGFKCKYLRKNFVHAPNSCALVPKTPLNKKSIRYQSKLSLVQAFKSASKVCFIAIHPKVHIIKQIITTPIHVHNQFGSASLRCGGSRSAPIASDRSRSPRGRLVNRCSWKIFLNTFHENIAHLDSPWLAVRRVIPSVVEKSGHAANS